MESEKQWKLKTRMTKGVSGSPNPDLNTTQLLWPLQVYEFPLTHVKDLRGGLGTTCTDCLSSIELYRSKNKLKTSLHLVFWKNSRSPCQASDAIQGLQQQQSLCSRHWGQNQLKVEDMGQSTRLNCGCSTSKSGIRMSRVWKLSKAWKPGRWIGHKPGASSSQAGWGCLMSWCLCPSYIRRYMLCNQK